jgi:hypothetical protein
MGISQALRKLLKKEATASRYDVTESGVIFPRADVMVAGTYFDWINGDFVGETPNKVVGEGLALLLSVALGNTAKPSNYYLTIHKGDATVVAGWTGSNYHSNATEADSTEGYSESTRPVWTDGAATQGGSPTGSNASMDNVGNEATFTMYSATTSAITVWGAGLLTANTKGVGGGTLVSATKYGAARTLQTGDDYKIAYRVTITG